MEKKILILITTLLICLNLLSQSTKTAHVSCATPEPTKEQIKHTLDVISQISTVRNGNTTHLPIRFHLIRRNDGSGGIQISELNKAVGTLNTYFEPIDLEFFIADINIIDDSKYFALDFDTEKDALTDAYQVNDAVNIYMADRITKSGYEICGYSYYPSEDTESLRMFMANGCTNDGVSANFPHEFGHFFNLYHTFRGTSVGADDPNAECVARSGSEANCSTHGDLICDTDADPRGYVNSSCNYIGSETDLFGMPFTPPIGNVMTYYSKKCGADFTPGQYDRMYQGLAARLSYSTYDIDGAQFQNVANPSDLTATVGADYTIELNWKDNSDNETGFLVERSEDNGNTFSPITLGGAGVNATSFHDASVESTKMYVYRIKASNDNPDHYSNTTVIESALTYCLPDYQQNSCELLEVGAGIQRFNIGGNDNLINNTSDCQGPYSVYVQEVPAGQLSTGSTYPFTIDFMQADGVHVPQNVSIWADLNQDGNFDNSQELLYKSNFGFSGPTTATGSITIPCNALTGQTTLRVRTLYLPMGMVEDPCKHYHFGEAEDYALLISEGQSEFASISLSEYSGAALNDGVVCGDAPVNLVGTGGVNYIWEDGTIGPFRTVQGAGTYTVTVTNIIGCEDVRSITISEEDSLEGAIIMDDNLALCAGDEVQLIAQGGDTYLWDNGSALPYRVANISGTYSVTISDQGGCSTIESIVVDFDEAPVANIVLEETSGMQNNDGKICQGDAATLTVAGGLHYMWEDGVTSATRVVTKAGTYKVTVSNQSGCTAEGVIDVEVNEISEAKLFANGVEVQGLLEMCKGEVVEISTQGQQVVWENGSTDETRLVNESKTLTATITNSEGCQRITEVEVVVRDYVAAKVLTLDSSGSTVNDGIACPGDAVVLLANGGVSYAWTQGSNGSSISVTESGFYSVLVTDEFGCSAATSVGVVISTPSEPTITLEETSGIRANDGVFCQGESVSLNVIGGENLVWENGSTTTARVVNKSGVYTIESSNDEGCKISQSITLTELTAPKISVSIENESQPEINFLSYGDTARLVASGSDNYTWSTGETSEAISVQTDGLFTVNTIDENMCAGETSSYVAFSLILSIDGLEVSAEANYGYNTINWNIPSDDNIEYYEVQRKVGNSNFNTIAQVASERSQMDPFYSVDDADLVENGSHYYRVKTIDQASNVDYSEIVVINVQKPVVEQANKMRVYPNPSRGLVNIDLPKYNDEECSVTLNVRNEMGTVVFTEVLAGEQYAEIETYNVNLAALAQGMYFVEVLRCSTRDVQRLMIAD